MSTTIENALGKKVSDIQNKQILNILISHSAVETGKKHYSAHVLDYNICLEAITPSEAVKKVIAQIKENIRTQNYLNHKLSDFSEDYLHDVFRIAPPMNWNGSQKPELIGHYLDVRDFSELENKSK